MKVVIGSDHAGFELKKHLTAYMDKKNILYVDVGTKSSTEKSDYPDIAGKVCAKLTHHSFDVGVLICTRGGGMAAAANKFRSIMAITCHNVDSAEYARFHNNANILCLGAKYVKKGLAKKMLDVFLETPFKSGGRYERRVNKIKNLEDTLYPERFFLYELI